MEIANALMKGKYDGKLVTRYEYGKELLDFTKIHFGNKYGFLIHKTYKDRPPRVRFYTVVELHKIVFSKKKSGTKICGCIFLNSKHDDYFLAKKTSTPIPAWYLNISIFRLKNPHTHITYDRQGRGIYEIDCGSEQYVISFFLLGIPWNIERLIWAGYFKNPLMYKGLSGITYRIHPEEYPTLFNNSRRKPYFEEGCLFSILPRDIIKIIIEYAISSDECTDYISKKRKTDQH
jgi:hypothetical protein